MLVLPLLPMWAKIKNPSLDPTTPISSTINSSSKRSLKIIAITNSHIQVLLSASFGTNSTMSDKCGNCDCSDQSRCVKKGSAYGIDIIETETSYVAMDAPAETENCGKCKCGTSCSCANCTCCTH